MSERIQNVDHHQEIEYNGRKFRSKFEAKTAENLDRMGIPFQYEGRKIELLEGFRSPFQKEKVRSITYTPDFTIGPLMIECKGFETPEWKLKKKLVFKWLQENEPEVIFYIVKDNRQLLECLDKHWCYLSYCVEVTNKPSRKQPAQTKRYDSIREALEDLGMPGRSMTSIIRSLTGEVEYIFGYHWRLRKLEL